MEIAMPFIYTPTVGEACQLFGDIYREAEGVYLSYRDKGQILNILKNWQHNQKGEISIIVVTDGSRILGLGDLGASGMGIPIGKLSIYVAAGGFDPSTTLPILIDTGTDNQKLLNDEFYLGEKHTRLADDKYYDLLDEFMVSVKSLWPNAVLQFEDFSNNHCFDLLDKYRNTQLCFNDDIQGTGVVVAAGFLNAIRLARLDPKTCRVLFVGAGSAGIGVADQIVKALHLKYNMSEDDCKKLFYAVDSKGLITTHRGDTLASFKEPYARKDITQNLIKLEDIITHIKPHAIIGLSGKRGTFNEDCIKLMSQFNDQPIVFALSNPTSNSECSFQEAFDWSKGKVIFSSGSPFPDIHANGKVYMASQGNNMYAFPGLGFGAYLGQVQCLNDLMITEATLALSDAVTDDQLLTGRLYPPISKVREISSLIAERVIKSAQRQNLCKATNLPDNLLNWINSLKYTPKYK